MSTLPKLHYTQLAPTRDYLQDIAKVIGKVQQQFLPADANSWNKGLLVTSNGLSTHELHDNQFVIDLRRGEVRGFKNKWRLGSISPPNLLEEIKKATGKDVETPEYTTKAMEYDQDQAEALCDSFTIVSEQLAYLKSKIKKGITSPVLLFPHHFDVSMVWFTHRMAAADASQKQFTFGYSTGDQNITEPYFYVTAYPETEKFKIIKLDNPAYWQTEGFNAAIITQADVASNNADGALASFFKSFIDAQIKDFIL